MDQLLKQNIELKQQQEQYRQQVDQLKQRSTQHQNQIQTLLKFNEKLLHIIEKQLNSQNIKSSDIISLQPISQKTQQQSDVFQSQLHNNFMNQIVAQKRSLNFPTMSKNKMRKTTGGGEKLDIYQDHFREPMANIERQEQLSIVVDGQREFKDEEWEGQVYSLIAQFRRPLTIGSDTQSIQQISQQIKSEIQQFEEIKTGSKEYYETRLQKLFEIRQNFIEMDSYSEIQNMIQNLQAEQTIKDMIREYLQEV